MVVTLLIFVPYLFLCCKSYQVAAQGENVSVKIWEMSFPTVHYPPREAVDSMSFEVLQYNLFGRPYEVSKDGQDERLQRVPQSLHRISTSIDVVTFAEADIQLQRKEMLKTFESYGYNYSTTILHDPDPFTSIVNGGVMMVSKWPIIREGQHIYRNACHYSDCLAAKGVKYARILKTMNGTSKIFNVFATHMQAWSTPEGRSDRIMQAKQMRQFIDAIGIPYHEPLLFAGDFNVDNHTYRDEVAHLVELLKSHEPLQTGNQIFTSDPRTNVLVGRDGAAISNKCSAQYIKNWGPLKDGTFSPSSLTRTTCEKHRARIKSKSLMKVNSEMMCYCPCCPLEWLDYVLYGKAPYQQPKIMPTLEAHVNQVEHFTVDWTAPQSNVKMTLIDLSDHYPVHGKFEFQVTRGKGKDNDPLTYHLDGCSTDKDCHFRDFRCYCTGSNCFFNGKTTDGWNLDSEHPVNRNCLYEKSSFQCLCGPT